jgi:fumarate hydratase class II
MSEQRRTERDALGEISVSSDALWGASTQRAVQNFQLSGRPVSPEIVQALAAIKAAAAAANHELGVLDTPRAEAIITAARSVASGLHADQFPVDRFQTGSGTSTNMNVNEVVASLARAASGLDIHPNDHVNASQSSNDTFPTAIHLAVLMVMRDQLVPDLQGLEDALLVKSREWAFVVKPGRTHLMDAAPVTLGQELDGFAGLVRSAIGRIEGVVPQLLEVPLGGTAVGTGLNAPPGFADRVRAELADATGIVLVAPASPMAAQSSRDALVELSGALRTLALSMHKICNDLRWMGSGPMAGLGEITLPALQPGSSIMPGKVNPVVPEAVMQACFQVVGLDAAIAMGATASNFQLNTAMPLMGCNLVDQLQLLSSSAVALLRLIPEITADPSRLRAAAESSPAVATSLNLLVGYDAAASVVKDAAARGVSIREAAAALVAQGLITAEQLDDAWDLDRMAGGPSHTG